MTKTPALQSSTDGCVTGVFLLARRIHVLLAGISTAARKKGAASLNQQRLSLIMPYPMTVSHWTGCEQAGH